MIDAQVLRGVLSTLPEDSGGETFRDFKFADPIDNSTQPIGGTRMESFENARFKSFVRRLGMAAVGGGFLIGPMWLMVLHNTRYTALISTSVCVFIFGVTMASVLEHLMNVLSVTAAYAAVLVVFVGTNTGTNTFA
jgi:hypothetical protein